MTGALRGRQRPGLDPLRRWGSPLLRGGGDLLCNLCAGAPLRRGGGAPLRRAPLRRGGARVGRGGARVGRLAAAALVVRSDRSGG
jgi:hypothetical protein